MNKSNIFLLLIASISSWFFWTTIPDVNVNDSIYKIDHIKNLGDRHQAIIDFLGNYIFHNLYLLLLYIIVLKIFLYILQKKTKYKSLKYFGNWYIGLTAALLILNELPWKYISPITTIFSLGVLPFIPRILQKMSRDVLKDQFTNNVGVNRLKQNMIIVKNKRK